MTTVVEDVPKLTVGQLRALKEWPSIRSRREATLVVEVDGRRRTVSVPLVVEDVRGGARHWLACPSCGSRRRNLHVSAGAVACRACLGLLYAEQAMPPAAWKRRVAIPILRSLGGLGSVPT
jgi:hypothetical protein